MSQHLSSQQTTACLIGAGDPSGQEHARECAACRAEIDALARPLALFRSSVCHWSKRQMSSAFETAPVLLLTPESLDRAWYSNIIAAIREAIHPPELPPLEVTSKPVDVEEMWGWYHGNETRSGLYSLLIHACVIALILWIGSLKPVQQFATERIILFAPDLKPYLASNKDQFHRGGGGTRTPLDASTGRLPKIAPRQFTPPRVDPPADPKLPMAPTIVAQADIPNINAADLGDPLSKLGVPSNGTGLSGGIGSGIGGGVGSGRGAGVGPGSGGGFGGGVYRIGGGVSAPAVLFKVEPEYSEEARKAKWQGTVVLSLIVDDKGRPQELKIVRSLGLGLDQKAIEAVMKWRFKPGMKDGKSVAVIATIEVNFRLL
jgi:protein TonB